MRPKTAQLACFLAFLTCGFGGFCASTSPARIVANDNRTPAGELKNGVLTLHLELGEGQWHPLREDGESFTVYAFGEQGKPLQNPGPLLRVPEGTEIQAIVHNGLPVAATVHGLHTRPGESKDSLVVESGETQEVRFKAGVAGSYYYWASTTGGTIAKRAPRESQLSGAFIVDSPGTPPADRVFVIGVYFQEPAFRIGIAQEGVINGKAWPYAERPTLKLGESVHWRWLNTSPSEHSMHLHGFYYRVDAAGDGERSQFYAETERPLVVTRFVESGDTFDMTWTPDRAGRWLFHCHMLIHMLPTEWNGAAVVPANGHGIPQFVPREAVASAGTTAPAYQHQHEENPETAGMGGIVLGVTVDDDKEKKPEHDWHAERKVQLTIQERSEGASRRFSLDVRNQGDPATPLFGNDSLVGPPIVLTAGQPTEIEVLNRTSRPTVIHWHGMELESYYDGVAGWTGTSQQPSPPIQPGSSFVARMTPPRAGTFIYHTHWHDEDQLSNGIYGPLIVLPPGQKFDPATDKIFLFGSGVFGPLGKMLVINGGPQPGRMVLATHTKYRFRLINISDNFGRMRASLRQNGVPVEWRALAKDGAELPESARIRKPADTTITVGETYDFEYETDAPQDLVLEGLLFNLKVRTSQGLVFADNRSGN